ncbi:MAG: NTP transferase domain-containing protein [Candidatus Omnitrophica bacterium]|nr:NTP transferase domain-containing protein [Candidatus Omnitrophota bacterium]
MHKDIAAVILAAGKGKRMKSDVPKILHPLCERPMLEYVMDLVEALAIKRKILVLGENHLLIEKQIKKRKGWEIVIQKRQLGTADAVKTTDNLLKGFKGELLILYADHPLFRKETIRKLIEHQQRENLDLTLLTAVVKRPKGYGRIIRDKWGNISEVLEEDKLNEYQKRIKEINLGVYCCKKESLFSVLNQIKRNNRQKEFYLTDAVGLLYKKNALIDAVKIINTDEALGVNSYADLARANRIIQERIIERLLSEGVKIIDPFTTFIAYTTQIGKGSVIYPFTIIEKDVKIGKNCSIGPFAHIRPGTVIEDKVVLGNFIEVVRSRIKSNSRAKHFSYLGDAIIGRDVNIGAGTVTANFDGKKKNRTVIKDKAFIGSDTILIAPLRIGKNAVTAAGSVIPHHHNVADNQIVLGVPARPIKK